MGVITYPNADRMVPSAFVAAFLHAAFSRFDLCVLGMYGGGGGDDDGVIDTPPVFRNSSASPSH